MFTPNKTLGCITLMIGLFLVLLITSCSLGSHFPNSPDGRYEAKWVGDHYQVVEIKTGRVVLTTRAEFTTPNDVKTGGFSSDSKKFAATYHYGHAGNYTWIGVWSTETGEFLYSKSKSGWTTSLAGVFKEKKG